MSLKITIGKSHNNLLVVNHPSVSNTHAILDVENNVYTLSDLGSTNGTSVDGIKIIKKRVTLDEEIKLGEAKLETRLVKDKIKQLQLNIKSDFTNEFALLESLFNEYTKKLNQLESSEKIKPQIIKLAITLALMGISYLIFRNVSYMMIIGVASGVITNFVVKSSTIKEKRENLQFEYSHKLVCPKCGSEMIQKSWKYWALKGTCSNTLCDAKWN